LARAGSIAFVDAMGLLKVGPEVPVLSRDRHAMASAAKSPPSPDADLFLGFLDPDYFWGRDAAPT
jgi:hypothetical protein